ncbi:MAG: LapA family protein [Microgenomates group bacterium]
MLVSVNFGSFVVYDIPLFYVIVGSILFGLVLSYLVHLVNSVSTNLTLRGKNNQIKKEKEEVLELTKRVHQLELENEKIKHEPVVENDDQNAL